MKRSEKLILATLVGGFGAVLLSHWNMHRRASGIIAELATHFRESEDIAAQLSVHLLNPQAACFTAK